MSEYTPTTEEVCDRASRSRTYPDFVSPKRQVEFHRWLAAHDAEVRASVVAEEPEGQRSEPVNRIEQALRAEARRILSLLLRERGELAKSSATTAPRTPRRRNPYVEDRS